MFQVVATLLMLSSFAVHTVLGCCWHHDHREPADLVASKSGEPIREHIHRGCPGHHHHAPAERTADEDAPAPSECPVSDCDEPSCTYLTSTPTKLPLPEWQPLDDMPPLSVQAAIAAGPLGPGGALAGGIPDPPLERFPIRDLTQVWLL